MQFSLTFFSFLSLNLNYGLINYWSMDNSVNDSVSKAHMFNGSNFEFVKDRFGNPNSAIRFSDGYYQVPQGVYFNGDFSISVWIKAINTLGSWGKIIDFGNGAPSDNIQFIASSASTSMPVFYIFVNNFESHVDPSLPLIIGQWTHLVFTLSGSTGTLYMNGLKISQSFDMYAPRNVNRTFNYVGKSNWVGDANFWGDVDDLRIYNRPLSQSEVNYLFLQQPNPQASNLIKYVFLLKKLKMLLSPYLNL